VDGKNCWISTAACVSFIFECGAELVCNLYHFKIFGQVGSAQHVFFIWNAGYLHKGRTVPNLIQWCLLYAFLRLFSESALVLGPWPAPDQWLEAYSLTSASQWCLVPTLRTVLSSSSREWVARRVLQIIHDMHDSMQWGYSLQSTSSWALGAVCQVLTTASQYNNIVLISEPVQPDGCQPQLSDNSMWILRAVREQSVVCRLCLSTLSFLLPIPHSSLPLHHSNGLKPSTHPLGTCFK
jgi:hypothetical protein